MYINNHIKVSHFFLSNFGNVDAFPAFQKKPKPYPFYK